ncbi:MAG: magnesium transporter [Solirubrobacteraceae bacterium]|jgi:magnesium transporter|nr:magnesium transporter [Solirubrobacteraceae bacterium]
MPNAPQAKSFPCFTDVGDEAVAQHLREDWFFWLDLEAPTEAQVRQLGDSFGLHPLTIEDALTFDQRPKIEEYDTYVFLVVFGADPGTVSGQPLLREVHVIISGSFVVTLHRPPFAALQELRARYETHTARSEQFIVYKILDAVITTFLPVLARIDEDIDEIQDAIIEQPTDESLQRIFALKRDLVAMRRVVTPLRDVFARDAERITDLPGLEADDRLYLRDVYDSLIRVSDLVDSYRDLLSGATDMYLSTVANRQGEINKQLTIIATIFLPLTFLTGFFGQNFAYLTNHVINTTWSFVTFGLVLTVLSTVGFLILFRRRRWL